MSRPIVTRPEVKLLLACTRTAIDAGTAARIQGLLQQDLDWDYLLQTARRHAVVPLVYWTLHASFASAVPPATLELLRSQYRESAQHSLALTGELLKLLGLFEAQGIRAIPLKGPVLAAMAYGNLSLRRFGDLDILVRHPDVLRAKQILLSQGYRPEPELTCRQEALHLQTHYVYTFVHDGSAAVVELHYRIRPRYFSFTLDPGQLQRSLELIAVGSKHVWSLSPEDTLLILCAHGANHCWERLAWICDIAELLRTHPSLNWRQVQEQARTVGSERMLLLGLWLAHELLDAELPQELVDRARGDRMLQLLAGQVSQDLFREREAAPGLFESAFFHLRARERWRDRVRYCLGVAMVTTAEDWALFPLPVSLSFIYSLIRPIRLLGRYGRDPLRRLYARGAAHPR